jgi:hypothetical protein
MSTKPFGFAKVPTPGIVIVTPLPDGSLMFHESLTVALPPIQTDPGEAVNELMTGDGQALAVTVLCAVAELPQPLLAVRV